MLVLAGVVARATDALTADKSSRISSDVFLVISSTRVHPNASDLSGRSFTVQMDKDTST